MNKIKYIIIILVAVVTFSCDVDYYGDPNRPEVAPTYGIMNRVQKRLMDNTRDEWFSGRMTLLWVQYWNQTAYTEEDRYQYRETTNQNGWDDIYKNAQDLRDLIEFNTNEATKGSMASYGANENQIAAARIMLVYIYQIATEMWGDVPYYSYGSDNTSFQANSIKSKDITTPAYAKQSDIYADMLKELDEAQAMILIDEKMIDGDNFFDGNAKQWKKFANSLRLRIANRVKKVYPAAASHITEAVTAGVIESNDDNAGVTYMTDALNAAPMHRAFYVENRTDFAPSWSFVELLQGKRGPFSSDPRLNVFVDDNEDGYKVGIPLTSDNGEVSDFNKESLPGKAILAADYTEIYMEYAEVCFILSEVNSWDQGWYEKGVRASMERWGISSSQIENYVASLPAASEENVLTQKYIALYMQPMEAWSEYRRTGYPKTFIKPNETYNYIYPVKDANGIVSEVTDTYTYGVGDLASDLPNRVKYLLNEFSVNKTNAEAAKTSMGGDELATKMWWQN